MREKQNRRRYDVEFKREAIRLVVEGGRTAVAVARDLGIEPKILQRWKREFMDDPDNSFPGKGHLKPADEELWRLKKELMDVIEERDILKKALAIFSKRPK
jgi:transposase